jgi:glycosyltransferase involved in cell wall biosynthesis
VTRLVHVTTTDISLALLLGPQLAAFAAAGYEVIGVSAPGPWMDRLDALGVRHVPLHHATRSWAPSEDVKALAELRRVFRDLRPEIVHTHNPKPGVYGRIAARLARVPVVVNTVHGVYALPDDPLAKRLPVYALERLAAACSDAELVQGPEDIETLASIGIPRRKLVHLGNGIDLRRFDPAAMTPEARAAIRAEIGAADGDVVVGVVGRLVREKGFEEVFAAARLLRQEAPNVRMAVIGIAEPHKADGYSAADIDALARDAGVVFLGARDDMPECYAAMDVFAFASHREGFPRAPMEAAAMGVPVVITDVRGCRETVEDGVTGELVPVRDARALASAIARLAADPERRAAYGAAGREKARREFDDRRLVATTLGVYERALERRGLRAPSIYGGGA